MLSARVQPAARRRFPRRDIAAGIALAFLVGGTSAAIAGPLLRQEVAPGPARTMPLEIEGQQCTVGIYAAQWDDTTSASTIAAATTFLNDLRITPAQIDQTIAESTGFGDEEPSARAIRVLGLVNTVSDEVGQELLAAGITQQVSWSTDAVRCQDAAQ
ncbi:hypothetical protein [Clavibacter michiganensis]|nr:hypothetical protein [Clavibacter michiganensis]